LLLSSVLAALPDARVSGPADIDIQEVAYDSRQVIPGSLFVAVPSVGGDPESGGSRFVSEAIRRGAVAVLTQGNQDITGLTTIRVSDARTALAECAAAFYGYPSRELQLYAVTGTDGKTTTSYLLEQLLAQSGYVTGLLGTVEIKIGDRRHSNLDRMTTPESVDVQRLLCAMVDAGVTHAVLEASSHALALGRLRGCSFAACALTNITADHVEFHGSWEAYFLTKASLFTDLSRGRPAILNRDDPHFARLQSMIAAAVLTYGFGPEADIRATNVIPDSKGTGFTITHNSSSAAAHIPLPGTYNVSNALAATGLALQAGLTLDVIADGLSHAHPPPGRMQRVDVGQPFEVIVDYAHTSHAFRSVLATLRERTPAPRRLIAVFGATGDRDRGKRPELARLAHQYADFFVITNEDPYGEDPETIIEEVAAGAPHEEEGIRYLREIDRGRAIAEAVARAHPGDTVVILGKGHEQSIVVDGRKQPWSDVSAAHQALQVLP
jgi:UDP-N-acetylmuramoyl-L-alanyl-D-glutamate--2,6-diaminopimelate ligase